MAIVMVATFTTTTFIADAASAADSKPSHAVVKPDSCPPETFYDFSSNTAGWMAGWGSYFLAGPGSVSYTATYTANVQGTVTGSISGSVSIVIASLQSQVGISLSAGVSKSVAENYTLQVPSGHTARAVIGHRGYRDATVQKTQRPNCSVVTDGTGTTYAPVSSTDFSTYCIHQDDYPASTWETASGGCVNQS